MATAYSYVRFSHSSQAKGRSEDRQQEHAVQWCEENGHVLDTRLKPDRGVSAYTGDNRVKGSFGEFLRMVQAGKVEHGSFLIVEEIDRISREAEVQVLNTMTSIALAGVKIVTLADGEVYDDKTDGLGWMRALMMAMRAHNESKTKTKRVRDAWESKKKAARETRKPISKRCPAWLVLREDRTGYDEIKPRAEKLLQMFRDADAGIGVMKIAQRLNDAKEPVWGRAKNGWEHSLVLSYLKSRACIGEYQPGRNRRGEARTTEGDAIPKFYPVTIPPDLFYRVQAKLSSRNLRGKKGRKGKTLTNIFGGVQLRCAECGGGVIVQAKGGAKGGQAAFRCSAGWRKHGCGHRTRYLLPPLEAAILRSVPDFDIRARRAADLALPEQAELDAALGVKADIEAAISNLTDMAEGGNKAILARLDQRQAELEAHERTVKELEHRASEARARMPSEAAQMAVEGLLVQMATITDPDALYDVRAQISEAISAVVSEIEFRPDRIVNVVLTGGLKAYQFRDGELVGSTDILANIGQRGVPPLAVFLHLFGGNDPEKQKAIVQMAAQSARKAS